MMTAIDSCQHKMTRGRSRRDAGHQVCNALDSNHAIQQDHYGGNRSSASERVTNGRPYCRTIIEKNIMIGTKNVGICPNLQKI